MFGLCNGTSTDNFIKFEFGAVALSYNILPKLPTHMTKLTLLVWEVSVCSFGLMRQPHYNDYVYSGIMTLVQSREENTNSL